MKSQRVLASAVAGAMAIAQLLFGASALADTRSGNGGFIGVGYGWFDKISDDSQGVLITVEERDPRIFTGYRFNRYIGLQFDAIFSDVDLCVGGICSGVNPILGEISVRPSIPLGKWFELYGRVGYVVLIDDDDTGASSDEASWALGAEVRPWKNLFVRAEYFGVEYKSSSFEDGGISINVGWNFFER